MENFTEIVTRKLKTRIAGKKTLGEDFDESEFDDSQIQQKEVEHEFKIYNENLSYLIENNTVNSNVAITGSKNPIGRMKIFIKRFIRKSIKWYLDPIVEQQNRLNAHYVSSLHRAEKISEYFKQENDRLHTEIFYLKESNDYFNKRFDKADENMAYFGSQIKRISQDSFKKKSTSVSGESDVNYQDTERTSLNNSVIDDNKIDFDYFLFENRFRGTRDWVKSTQIKYLKYFENKQNVLDIGCGRGEFLDILREKSISCKGVDIVDSFVYFNQQNGHDVEQADALTYLDSLEDNSLGGIFMSQVLEHLESDYIYKLVQLAYAKLKPGCFFIAETPNPSNLAIFHNYFYVDMTHIRPVHPDIIKYIFEYFGFNDVEHLYSSKTDFSIPQLVISDYNLSSFNDAMKRVSDTLYGYQDYAVIGKK
ncbi:MAG: class I SAM-dependent methyltransferase [Oscillospiraceae bacterium]|nr:class I SAM-dependent methyltransferase [Oscillospiraceae bacterium]